MAPVLLVLFLVVPLVEIYLISRVGHLIGLPLTLGVLLAVSVLGAVVVKREGVRAWGNLREAVTSGRMPTREMADGALVLVGGVLLLTPGFLTDAVGFLFVLPASRPLVRRLLTTLVLRRFLPLGPAIGATRLGTGAWRRSRGPRGQARIGETGRLPRQPWH